MPIVHDPNSGKFVSSIGGSASGTSGGVRIEQSPKRARSFGSKKVALASVPAGHTGTTIERSTGKHIVLVHKEGQRLGYLG